MIATLFTNPTSRRLFIATGALGLLVILGAGIYAMEIYAVTPHVVPAVSATVTASTTRTISLKEVRLQVSVADTDASREQGLSGRAGLAEDEGMLFIFPIDGQYAFWMKDMRFSIDMVWLSSDGSVVYIVKNAAPETYPNDFVSPSPARYVLELPAGWASMHSLKIGDKAAL